MLDSRIKIFVNNDVDFSQQSRDKLLEALGLDDIQEIIVLPDIHSKPDNPFPTGIVTLTKNTVYPYAIGQEIGCGMRVLKTSLSIQDLDRSAIDILFKRIKDLLRDHLKKKEIFSKKEYLSILADGHRWAKQNYNIEKEASVFINQVYGEIEPPLSVREVISSLPKDAFWGGYFRLGTLGGGNHFLEAQVVDKVMDQAAAKRLGIKEGQIIFMFHTGSGVLSKRLDNYYGIRYENNIWYKDLRKRLRKYSFHFSDLRLWRFYKRNRIFFSREFKGISADSLEAKRFVTAMKALLNYSFVNRAIISDFIRKALSEVVKKDFSIEFFSDTTHERIDYEEFNGGNYWAHRNGAVKVYYRNADMEILPIPGFMGGPSFLCLPQKGVIGSRYSVNHGAGRVFDKQEAKSKFSSQDICGVLEQKGVRLFKLGNEDIREQAPAAFKDVYKVLESLKSNHLVAPIASTFPLAILKG